jgi:uncharacterized protein (TIGR02001 family)
MFTKKLLPAAITAAALLGAGQVMAEQDAVVTGDEYKGITGNVTLTSDYRFRGISQSDEDVALQGGFDYAWDTGIYIGTWGSTVDFGGGDFGSLELDYYVGWAMDITDNVNIDVGYMYYDYPGDSSCCEGDYQEIYGKIGWRGLTVGANYSDDYYAETGDFWYLFADYGFSFASDAWSLNFHVGYNDLEKTKWDEDGNVTDGGFLATDTDSYVDYSVTLGTTWIGVDWALAYVGTDLDKEDLTFCDLSTDPTCSKSDLGEDTVVFSISRSL